MFRSAGNSRCDSSPVLSRSHSIITPPAIVQRSAPLFTTRQAAATTVRALAWVDPGFLFVIAGCALLAAITLIPARAGLAQAQAAHNQAAREERLAMERLKLHSDFLDMLHAGDSDALEAVAADQLRQAPPGKTLLAPMTRGTSAPGQTLRWLEPRARTVASAATANTKTPMSLLARIAMDDQSRLVVMTLAAAVVFAGLLPPTIGQRNKRRNAPQCEAPPRKDAQDKRRTRGAGAQRFDLTQSPPRWTA